MIIQTLGGLGLFSLGMKMGGYCFNIATGVNRIL